MASLLIFACVSVLAEEDPYIFNVQRINGQLVTVHKGFLGLIHDQYVGYKNVEYRTNQNVVTVSCTDPGNNRCSIKTPDGARHTFRVGNNTFEFSDYESLFDQMLLYMEDKIVEGAFVGVYYKKINTISIEGNNIGIVFQLEWNLDNTGNGDVYVIAKACDYGKIE